MFFGAPVGSCWILWRGSRQSDVSGGSGSLSGCGDEQSSAFEAGDTGDAVLKYIDLSAWWFGTFFMFPYIENNNPN